MSELILVKLRGLDKIRTEILASIDIYLNFTAHTTSLRMLAHEVDEFLDGIVVWACSNIKHQTVLWLQVLADTLEEPLMRVDFTIVSVLDAEHEVDTSTTQVVSLDAKVPSCDLKAVQNIAGNLFRVNTLVHDITHIAHLEFFFTIELHETFLEEDFLIKEAFFTSQ